MHTYGSSHFGKPTANYGVTSAVSAKINAAHSAICMTRIDLEQQEEALDKQKHTPVRVGT